MTTSGKKRVARISVDRRKESGFSVIELLLVVAIMVILTAIAVTNLTANKRLYSPDEEAAQAISFFREAYQRALSQRQTMRVRIDLERNLILLMDEGLLPGGDEVEVIRGVISHRVSIERPSINGVALNPPAAPYNYTTANFNSNIWSVRFRADGSAVDQIGDPLSATLFFVPSNLDENSIGLIRAVTVYGPTGTVRLWKLDKDTKEFIAGGE